MRVRITLSEEFSLSVSLEGGRECEVPLEIIDKWGSALKMWTDVQTEMFAYYKTGSTVLSDSSKVVPSLPLSDSIRKSNPDELPGYSMGFLTQLPAKCEHGTPQ